MHRRPVALALAAIVPLVLVGCLGRETEEIISLDWWLTYAPESPEYVALQALADAYAESTGHLINLVSVPWDEIVPKGYGTNRLADAQESGAAPDVWGPVPHSWTSVYAAEGYALALDSNEIRDRRQYMDVAIQACEYDDRLYALPVLVDSVALIYNRSLVPDPPESLEELVDLAESLVDEENDQWGLAVPLLGQYHIYPFMDAFDGYVLQCADGQCDPDDIGLNGEGAVQGIQFLSDLYLKEGLLPEPLADSAVMYTYALRLFTEGRAGMLIDGSWALPEIRASGVDYGVAAIPGWADATHDARPFVIVQAVYASAHSAYPAEAVGFLSYLASAEGALAIHQALGKTPVRRDVSRMPEIREPDIGVWREQAADGIPLPSMPDYVWALWGQALEEAIPGLVPVQDALDRAVEQIQAYMSEESSP